MAELTKTEIPEQYREGWTVIRSSGVGGVNDCFRRWAGSSLRKEVREAGYRLADLRKSIGAPVGTGVHAGAAFLLDLKAKSKRAEWKPLPETLRNATKHAMESFSHELTIEPIAPDDTTPNPTHAEMQIDAMLTVFARDVLHLLQPHMVERRLFAVVSEKQKIVLSGQGDLLTKTPEGDVVDFKTGRGKPRQYHAQLGTYSMLYRTYGQETRRASVIFIPRVKVSKPQPPATIIPYDLDLCEQVAESCIKDIVAKVAEFRETRNPMVFPANPNSSLCSATWCPCHGTSFCREHTDAETKTW